VHNVADWFLLGVVVLTLFGIICYLTVMMMDKHAENDDE